jgi:hypothetical protein
MLRFQMAESVAITAGRPHRSARKPTSACGRSNPAINTLADILDPRSLYTGAMKLAAAKDVLDRTGHKATDKLELTHSEHLVDVTKLSTPLLRQLKAELDQIAKRNQHPTTAAAAASWRADRI